LQGTKSVRGGLSKSSDYWKNTLGASRFVQNIIDEGYKIPFESLPPPCFLDNNKSAKDHSDFVAEAITELLAGGYVEEHPCPPNCVNPLTVAEGKKLRLVLDLRNVNKHLAHQSFRYEDLRSLAQLFEQNFWFFTWDLKSGYHHVDIYPLHRVLVLPKRPALCIPGEGQLIAYRSKPSLFMGTPSFDLLALRIEFGAK
jgi:hypothetical protein